MYVQWYVPEITAFRIHSVFALLVTNVGDGFPSLRDGRRSRARHAQAGDVGAHPTWMPNMGAQRAR